MKATVPPQVPGLLLFGWRDGRVILDGLPMSHLINHRKRRIRKKWRKRITLLFEA